MSEQGKNGKFGRRPRATPKSARVSGGRRIGRTRRIKDPANAFRALSEDDEAAAEVLAAAGHHRQAACMLIQAIEKSVHYGVYLQLTSSSLPMQIDDYGARLRTHDVDALLTVLLDVFRDAIGDKRVSEQIGQQLEQLVVQGLRFHHLHNDVRYLRTHQRDGRHSLLEVGFGDVRRLQQTLCRLRSFISGFQQLRETADLGTESRVPTQWDDADTSSWTFRF